MEVGNELATEPAGEEPLPISGSSRKHRRSGDVPGAEKASKKKKTLASSLLDPPAADDLWHLGSSDVPKGAIGLQVRYDSLPEWHD